ncbi:DUF6776 family protein [Ferrimonas senticii]|uniref:DUF6776 family protein n=1 Tax=Ferrimonas senticii TaxID=394566 RepID=UPI000420CC8D|nr:DUF6776 family protein [Ferrimonas senticii]
MAEPHNPPQQSWLKRLYPHWAVQLFVAIMLLLIGFAAMLPSQLQSELAKVDLEQQFELLLQENARLTELLETSELALTLEQQSASATQQTMLAQRQQLDELQTELAFYRSIMAPETIVDGVVVHHFTLNAMSEPHRWRYELVLSQQQVRKRWAKGQVSLLLVGSLNGQTVTLGLSQLGATQDRQDYSFRYFKQFDGELLLPQGFIAERAIVRVRQQGGKKVSDNDFAISRDVDGIHLQALTPKSS